MGGGPGEAGAPPGPSDEILTTWRNLKTSRSKNLDTPLPPSEGFMAEACPKKIWMALQWLRAEVLVLGVGHCHA